MMLGALRTISSLLAVLVASDRSSERSLATVPKSGSHDDTELHELQEAIPEGVEWFEPTGRELREGGILHDAIHNVKRAADLMKSVSGSAEDALKEHEDNVDEAKYHMDKSAQDIDDLPDKVLDELKYADEDRMRLMNNAVEGEFPQGEEDDNALDLTGESEEEGEEDTEGSDGEEEDEEDGGGKAKIPPLPPIREDHPHQKVPRKQPMFNDSFYTVPDERQVEQYDSNAYDGEYDQGDGGGWPGGGHDEHHEDDGDYGSGGDDYEDDEQGFGNSNRGQSNRGSRIPELGRHASQRSQKRKRGSEHRGRSIGVGVSQRGGSHFEAEQYDNVTAEQRRAYSRGMSRPQSRGSEAPSRGLANLKLMASIRGSRHGDMKSM